MGKSRRCLHLAAIIAFAAPFPTWGATAAGPPESGESAATGEAAEAPSPAPAYWREFCRELERAGSVLHQKGTPQDDLTQAEGLRHLVRLIRLGFESTVEFADPMRPRVVPAASDSMLGEGETSDARYHQAFIDGSQSYRLTGRRGTAPFIELSVYAGKIGIQAGSRQVGALLEKDLVLNRDGSFEVVLSPEEHPGNWIRTEPDASLLYIRQYAWDWSETESATFELERIGEATPRPPLSLDEMRTGLAATARFVERSARFWSAIVDRRAAAAANVFFEIPADPDPQRPTMPVGHRFAAGYFRLAPNEALLVTFRPGEAPYWGLDLTSYWFEPLSYGDHRSNVNNRTAVYSDDGRVEIILADRDPGRPNWLDLKGHREGTMLFRWSRSDDAVPKLEARVVKLRAL